MAESRVKKTLLNARVNLLFYLLALTFSFFSRKIFLDCLGADFIGLTGTLQNLLGFLNLNTAIANEPRLSHWYVGALLMLLTLWLIRQALRLGRLVSPQDH